MSIFVSPTDDVIVQEGTFGFSYIASGAISGGQLVKSSGPMMVVKATAYTDNPLGVAAYTVSKGDAVTVYGPYNIIRSYCPSTTTQGNCLYCTPAGAFVSSETYGGTSVPAGIALESVTAGNSCRILLK